MELVWKVCCIRPQPSAQKWEADFASAVALWIISAAGYDGLATTQTASALSAIKALYLWVPIPFYAIMILFYVFYKLDKIYPQVMEELKAREAAKEKH